jgi:hypothetical protein
MIANQSSYQHFPVIFTLISFKPRQKRKEATKNSLWQAKTER